MDIGDNFSISPIPLKGLHKNSLRICELFWDVYIEIYIFGKTQEINIYKTVSQFTQQLQDILKKYLSHNTIQKLNFVKGNFNVKN